MSPIFPNIFLSEVIWNDAHRDRLHLVFIRAVAGGVDLHHMLLAFGESSWIGVHMLHGPLKLGVRSADLVFIGAAVRIQSIRWRRFENVADDAHRTAELVHFGFKKVGDRANVHAAVAILGIEAYPEVFYL